MPVPVINAYCDLKRGPPSHLPVHSCGGQLYLYPISLDEQAQYYQCRACNTRIDLSERDRIFQEILEQTKSKFQLKTLEWSAEGGLRVESAVFIGEHRLVARRKSIKPTEKREIYDHILTGIQIKLGISVDNLHSLFKQEPDKYYPV
jgi:hypothetical protein